MTAEVLLVTCEQFPNLTADDRLVATALEQHGVTTAVACWDDPSVDWAGARVAVLRSTWDYHARYEEFARWLAYVSRQTTLVNPFELVTWNIHKRYLLELADRGVKCVPTKLIERDSVGSAVEMLRALDWADVVIKPAISGSAFKTLRVRSLAKSLDQAAGHLREVLGIGDALVQPYIPEVESSGERGLIFIETKFSHAYRKAPFDASLPGEEECMEARLFPSDEEWEFSRRVLDCLPAEPLYARVDIVPHASGPMLMEIEVTEPALHFRLVPEAATRFAEAVMKIVRYGIGRTSSPE